jgi:two-component system chemotaxis sensor kinase CheA
MQVNDYKALFTSEAGEILQALETGVMSLEEEGNRHARIDELFRNAHNLKGMSGAMGYDHVAEASHALENILDRFRSGEVAVAQPEVDLLLRAVDLLRELVGSTLEEDGSDRKTLLGEILVLLSPMTMRTTGEVKKESSDIAQVSGRETVINPSPERVTSTRVDIGRLNNLMDLVGELVIGRIKLLSIARQIGSKALNDELSSSGRLISEIQKEVMEARLIPVGQVFQRFKRLVRDMARELGKKVEFEISGADIGLDRSVLEKVFDPLVHLIRNAIDHGIETEEERTAAGKPGQGRVLLSARRERGFVVLEISDDGRGIDVDEVIADRDVSPGSDGDGMIDEETLCRVLSAPGFSTRSEVSMYSGRGVGMNVVREAIDELGGSMHLRTEKGTGTTVSMQLPVNLSIIKALLFEVGEDVHALPVEYVSDTSRIENGSFETVLGREILHEKGCAVPVVRPDKHFGLNSVKHDSRYIRIIFVRIEEDIVAVTTGRILGQQDIVIKGLPSMIRGLSGISGATILGSGRIAFIWDPRFLLKERCKDEPDKQAVVS